MTTIQDAKNPTELLVEELIGPLMTHEITTKSHQKVDD